jgi:phage-related protein
MPTFSWIPSYAGLSGTHKPKVYSIQFGDSYVQDAPAGMNPDLRTWDLSFTERSKMEAFAIETFLRAQGGVTRITWTIPDTAETVLVVCRTWSVPKPDAVGVYSITATFEEVVA